MKAYKIIKTIFYVALAIVIFIFHLEIKEYVQYLVGGIMLSYGLDFMLESIIGQKNPLKKKNITDAIIEILFGLFITIFVDERFVEVENELLKEDATFRTICVIWGVWSILREGREIEENIERHEKKLWGPFILNLVASIIVIVLSLMLVLDPEHAGLHIIFLVIEVILLVLTPQLDALWVKLFQKSDKGE